MAGLRPFWRYYGGKWRAAPRYPAPVHATIVEPFAGAAGYSLRYPDREVILVEKYHVIAEIWRWLIGVSVDEVMATPCVDCVHDLPDRIPQGARWFIGFCLQDTAKRPCHNLSAGMRRMREAGDYSRGWSETHRARVARQVDTIRHWKVVEGDYTAAPDVVATWFVDPPYQGAGVHYQHSSKDIDYPALSRWCRTRRGQVIVCESADATWLPFRPAYSFATRMNENKGVSREAIWTRDDREPAQLSLALEAA